MKKFIKVSLYLSAFFIFGTVFTIVSLKLIDKFIYELSQSSIIVAGKEEDKISSQILAASKIKLPENVENIQYSYNNKYYTYLKDGKIYVNNIKDGKNIKILEDSNPICYYNLLYDKNLIVYFTEQKNSNISKLVLKTYEIATERKSEYNKFSVENFSKIKDMNMSPIINIIYINVETKSNTYTNNIIYRLDLFNNMARVNSGLIVNKMIMLQHIDKIYYEDKNSNIYAGGTRINLFKEKVDMIGIDYDDNLYFLSQEKKNLVYKVQKGRIVKKIELSDTDIKETYTNNVGVYLIYPTYILNIAGTDPYKRIGKLSSYVQFEAVKEDTMYLRTSNNLLLKTELIKN